MNKIKLKRITFSVKSFLICFLAVDQNKSSVSQIRIYSQPSDLPLGRYFILYQIYVCMYVRTFMYLLTQVLLKISHIVDTKEDISEYDMYCVVSMIYLYNMKNTRHILGKNHRPQEITNYTQSYLSYIKQTKNIGSAGGVNKILKTSQDMKY